MLKMLIAIQASIRLFNIIFIRLKLHHKLFFTNPGLADFRLTFSHFNKPGKMPNQRLKPAIRPAEKYPLIAD
jgi:hypothetical protein